MNKITLTLPNKKGQGVAHDLSGPSCWAEVSHEQYLALCRVLLLMGQHPELRLTLPGVLYGLTPKQGTFLFDPEATRLAGYPPDMRADLLSYGQALLATTDWVFNSLPVKWPYRLQEQSTVGPGDGLKDLSFGEFMACETAFTRIMQGDKTQLPKLIAQLLSIPVSASAYQDAGPRRIETDFIVNSRAERWAKATVVEQYAYLLAYQGAREELASHFRYVFPKTDREEEQDPTAPHAPVSWYTLALDMAEGKVETFEHNARANVYLVLSLLNRQLAQQAETA